MELQGINRVCQWITEYLEQIEIRIAGKLWGQWLLRGQRKMGECTIRLLHI